MNLPYNIRDLVEIKVEKMEAAYGLCPFHHDTNPSFTIFTFKGKQYWRCHRCDLSGDIVDLVKRLKGVEYDEAVQIIRDTLPVNPPDIRPDSVLPQWSWETFLPVSPTIMRYAAKRGISLKSLREFKIGSASKVIDGVAVKDGYEKLMSIPTFHFDDLIGIKIRNIKGGKVRYWSVKGSKKGLWGYNDVAYISDPVILAKGEIAAIVLREHGFLSCAPTGGEASDIDQFRKIFIRAPILVIGDNDEKGVEAARMRAEILGGWAVFPPKNYKDVDEWLLDDSNAKCRIREWLDEIPTRK